MINRISIFGLILFFTCNVYSQLKVGSNATVISSTNNLEVEASGKQKVYINKTDGRTYIENRPTATVMDSVVMSANNGEIRQMSISRMIDQLDLDSDGIPNGTDLDDDGDGIPDSLDKCPLQYGCASTSANDPTHGCPVNCFKDFSTNGSATIASFDNCAAGSTGTMTQGTAVSGVTQTIIVTVSKAGTYNISTTANGVTFSGAGTLAVGSQTIVLTASGTPSASGTATFVLNTTPNCSFTRSINPIVLPNVFNCNNISISSNSYQLTNGAGYTGTVSIPYSNAVSGSSYPAETITQNGISLTRSAGTYASSGSIIYIISGTYSGASNTGMNFNTDVYAGSCSIYLFDAIRQAIVNGGNISDLNNYDATAQNGVVNISQASYNAIANMNTASKVFSTDAYMAGTPIHGCTGANNTIAYSSASFNSTYIAGGTYLVAFSVKTKALTGANYLGSKIKFSSNSQNSGFVDYTLGFPSLIQAAYTTYNFVIKRPSNTVPTNPTIAYFNPAGTNNDMIGAGPNNALTYSGTGDVSSLNSSFNNLAQIFFQGIQVTNKQW